MLVDVDLASVYRAKQVQCFRESVDMDTSPGIFVNVNLTDCLLFNFIMALLRKKKGFSKKKIEVDKIGLPYS